MKKRALDRDDVNDVQPDKARVKLVREVKSVSLRVSRVLGGIDADQDLLNHRLVPSYEVRDIMAPGRASRGVA